jgi:Ser/Thr protein kinase RdoA (MazF antagonist)
MVRRRPASIPPSTGCRALLRRVHDAEPATAWDGFAAAKLAELELWAGRAAGLLDRRELDFARAKVRALAGLGQQLAVPCHLDYSLRNWLIADGRLSVIDFEWARHDVWVNDLIRLYLGAWPGRPGLRDAFLAGYRHEIGPADREILLGCAALHCVWLTVRAREYSDTAFSETSRQSLRRLIAEDRRPGQIRT